MHLPIPAPEAKDIIMPASIIAHSLQQALFNSIAAVIHSREQALQYMYTHHRLCLTNKDKSAEPYWYPVYGRKQILEVTRYFCPEAAPSEHEAAVIIDAIIAGYNIDLSKPVYLSYDLNRQIPVMAVSRHD
jgi:hypothetical protein